jgi:hypothetical protein
MFYCNNDRLHTGPLFSNKTENTVYRASIFKKKELSTYSGVTATGLFVCSLFYDTLPELRAYSVE